MTRREAPERAAQVYARLANASLARANAGWDALVYEIEQKTRERIAAAQEYAGTLRDLARVVAKMIDASDALPPASAPSTTPSPFFPVVYCVVQEMAAAIDPFERHFRRFVNEHGIHLDQSTRETIERFILWCREQPARLQPVYERYRSALDPSAKAVWTRLDEIAKVRNGWYHGGGIAPGRLTVAYAGSLLTALLRKRTNVPRPTLYPTPEGAIQAEWLVGGWALDLRFEPDGTVCAESTNERDDVSDRTLSTSDVDDLGNWVEEHLGAV